MTVPPTADEQTPPATSSPYREISLVDLVVILFRRKYWIIGTVVVALLVGFSLSSVTPAKFESRATFIALDEEDITLNWLRSRRVAEQVIDELGARLESEFGRAAEEETDIARERRAAALQQRVTISDQRGLVEIVAEMSDARLARDVAAAYVASLDDLEGYLINISKVDAFDRYFKEQAGNDSEELAQRQATLFAEEKDYWILLDSASLPDSPSRPSVVLVLVLAATIGLVAGVLVAFTVEWWSANRGRLRTTG